MGRYSVLAVDNEPYSLICLQKFFHQPAYGFSCVHTAGNALAAIEQIHRETPDLIVSDIRMPQMDGIEFLQYLSREKIPSKVVLVSAYADFSYVQKALRYGAVDYLLKPVQEDEVRRVLQKIRQLLSQRDGGKEDEISMEDTQIAIKEFLRQNYMKPLQLQDLADFVHLTPNYCGVLFQKLFGTPFTKYLAALRLEKSTELLKMKHIPINRIAFLVGYSDVFYFSRLFKQKFGMSPSEYRDAHTNEDKGRDV